MKSIVNSLLVLMVLLCHSAKAETLTIAVASNFAPFLSSVLPKFTQKTGISTQIITASSGVLTQQIRYGAPYDIFFSADALRPKKLMAEHLIVPNSITTYAFGQLAFYSTHAHFSTWADFISQLKNNQQSHSSVKIALANPKLAPYGLASQQALQTHHLWPLNPKNIVVGQNISQTFQQLQSGAVTTGLVAMSQLIANNLKGEIIPLTDYQPIKQQLVILKNSKKISQAQQLVHFILSENIQASLSLSGYGRVSHHSITEQGAL